MVVRWLAVGGAGQRRNAVYKQIVGSFASIIRTCIRGQVGWSLSYAHTLVMPQPVPKVVL